MTTGRYDPDEIRSDIERTRATLSDDVDDLVGEVRPSSAGDRVRVRASDEGDYIGGSASASARTEEAARASAEEAARAGAEYATLAREADAARLRAMQAPKGSAEEEASAEEAARAEEAATARAKEALRAMEAARASAEEAATARAESPSPSQATRASTTPTGKVKASFNLLPEDINSLRTMAKQIGTTVTNMLQRSIRDERFIQDRLAEGNRFALIDSKGAAREIIWR
jgi:hypothetical protein